MTEPSSIKHYRTPTFSTYITSRENKPIVTVDMVAPRTVYSMHDTGGSRNVLRTSEPTVDEDGNPTLFNANHSTARITYLFSHGARPGDVTTSIGVASLHSQRQFGHLPTASPELSVDSAKMVNAINSHLGRPSVEPWMSKFTPTESKEVLDSAQRIMEGHMRYASDQVSDVPESDIKDGRSLVRSVLKAKHTNLSKTQFSHPELDLK